MRKFLFIQWFIATALLFLFWAPARAGVDPPVIKVLDGSLGQLKKDSLILVEDAKFFSSDTSLIRPYLVQNVVSFEFNEGIPVYIQGAFSDTIELQVIYTKADNSTVTEYKTWVLDYNTTGTYKHRNTFVFTGGYRVQVKVMSVRSNVAWDSWKALKVVSQLQAFPQYKFTYTGNVVTQVSDSAWTAGTDKDELPVWWQPSIGADEYDLEWAYIDSAALAAKRYGPDPNNPNPALLFDHNATRVSITGTAYRIPIIYDSKGHLFYRVRAVQQQSSGVRYEAMWTTFNTVGHGRFDFNGHERTLNWQATTTFAEEGKRKSVVQYYDGSLRGRQTVTKDNTTKRTIVAESFYDYQGRPVVQVLPAPTLNSIIGYTPNFNRGFNYPEYDKSLFDTLPSPDAYCSLQAAPMDSASGASQYYSGLSAFKDSGVHKYVPRAEGFPFTEVEYTQDNTGRISRQGGVGKDFRLGSGHETRYIYATPDQGELDALFGTEVGDKSHYFKNLVRDANGQYSISYVDMHGRTIATALAGTPDTASKLERLTSNNPATRTEVLADPYSAVIKDLVMEHKKSLAVTTAGNHDFNYVLNPLLLKEEGCNMDSVCYDCLYDLRITITDDCNNQKLGGAPFDTLISNFSMEAIDTVCNNGTGFAVSFTKWLPEGNYEITKQLSVSRYAMEYYRDSIFMAANTCKTLDSFIVEQRAIVQAQQNCKPSCQSCTDSLGSWSQYWQRFRQTNGIDNVDTAVYKNMALQSYAEAKQQCDELCNKLSDLTGIRKTMLMDMTPSSGQYANIDNEQDRYSVFFSHIDSSDNNQIKDTFPAYSLVSGYLDADGNPDLVFDESAGKLVPPQDLTPEVFAQRFKSSWAETLLPLHPEYCKLQRYEQWQASHEWDRLFEGTDTYADAVAKGYLNPLGETGTIATLFGPDGGDPLSDTAWFKPKLMDSLLHFRTIAGKRLSLWGLASITVMCPEGSSAGCYTPYLNTGSFPNDQPNSNAFNTTAMCAGELDMAWRSFRQLYLDIKRNLINKRIKEYCPNSLTAAKIVATGHQPHFSDAAELLALQPPIDKPATKKEGEALQQQYYEDNCKAYAHQWLQDLAPCTLYDTASLNNIIIPALINICKEGSDLKHPYGSSSVKPSSTAPATHRSFEAYLEYYNSTHNITNNQLCNAYLIKAPQPYDQQVVHGNKPLYTKPDTCECSTISRLYGQYKPKQTLYGSFSNYLARVYQTDIADSTLNTLLSLCGNADFPAPDCDFVSKAIFLPPVFQCNTGDICVDCAKFATLHAEFKQKFPSVTPAISYVVTTDSTQYKWNLLYEQFMNYRLGFVKTADDYLLFKGQCSGQGDSLQDIVDSFRINRQQQYGVKTDFQTEEVEHFTDLHQLIQNGAIQLPDTVRQRPATWFNNVGISLNGGKTFCSSGGYAVEARFRFLGTTTVFYANFGGLGATFYRADAAGAMGPPGVYVIGFTDDEGRRYGHEFGDTLFSYIQASADPDMSKWVTLKLQLTPTHRLLYFNNVLVLDIPRNGTLPIANIGTAGIGILSRQGNVDWWKVFDANGQVRYFEDYLDPDWPAMPDPAYLCPTAAPDCQADFVQYFNQQQGTTYTWSQLDSLYAAAAVPLTACFADTNANYKEDLTLCGRTEPVFPPTLLEAIDNCSDSTFIIQSKAQDLYSRYADSVKGRFDSSYRAQCLQAYKYERFTVRHTVSEYHYTLYYYDQAGNLVKTIPPAGVQPNYDSLWLDSVKTARLAGGIKLPAHALPTQYRYNTLNQVTAQKSPDGGKTEYWYDRLGRLALSRNARQLAMSSTNNNYYSYTKYDVLGRITEVGQLRDTLNQGITDTFTRNEMALTGWYASLQKNREQITNTIYDIPYIGFEEADPTLVTAQQNVRNRVSYVTYTDTPGVTSAYNHASFYSYDIHGNVDTLLQDYGQKGVVPNIMNKNGNRWKKLVYEYDLISGKVNKVMYQPRFSDQWTHRYYYDAENRLTEVETSTDGYTWEKEAKYEYYLHGPLARTIIGQQQVQGIDYAYTLQGWLKGVNSTGATIPHDIGGDALTGGINQYVARDALGFNLNYFSGDYKSINPGVNPFPSYRLAGASLPDSVYRPLYNGNISSMATHIRKFDELGHVPIFYNYRYDQLNRLVKQDAFFFSFNASTNSYGSNWAPDVTFHEDMSYDPNGNIQHYNRYAIGAGSQMDGLTYKYYPGSNKLRQVNDHIVVNKYGSNSWDLIYDLDDQTDTSNYVYDEIGNLIQDKQENVTSIKWNVYGKITEVNRTATAGNAYTKIAYSYDAQGNRIGKVANRNNGTKEFTWYVRDAQGNLMSTYVATGQDTVPDIRLQNLFLTQADVYLYGSSRLGMLARGSNAVDNGNNTGPWINPYYQGDNYNRGYRQYELTNHLGNVLTVISDRNKGVSSGGSLTLPNGATIPAVDYYDPDMLAANDYYPFGMLSRTMGTPDKYRFGFNGKETDNEVKGRQNQQDYGMRIYDPRLGRFLSVDPISKSYPELTPYQFASNTPIQALDIDGLEAGVPIVPYTPSGKPLSDQVLTGEDRKTYFKALGIGTAVGAAVVTDIFVTKGAMTRTVGTGFAIWSASEVYEHTNRNSHQKDPNIRAENERNAKNAAVNMLVGYGIEKSVSVLTKIIAGGGKVVYKYFSSNSIRFSQSSVSGLDEIAQSMKANGWKGDPIDIVKMEDGIYTTVDNTRLLAARQTGTTVKANAHNYDDAIPEEMAVRFADKKGNLPKTWGEAVKNRIKNQKREFRTNNESGSFVAPIVNDK